MTKWDLHTGMQVGLTPENQEDSNARLQEETSLVVQWLRICLPIQGTRVRALVREDPTCHRATKPVHHNY